MQKRELLKVVGKIPNSVLESGQLILVGDQRYIEGCGPIWEEFLAERLAQGWELAGEYGICLNGITEYFIAHLTRVLDPSNRHT
jgi:hypothetical protein